MSLTQAILCPADARRPDTTSLLPLTEYDFVIVSFSGGKDSLALLLHLIELGVPRDKIQLWHQHVDGEPGKSGGLMDWPCTEGYCRAVAKALGVRILFQWKHGGFEREMLRDASLTAPTSYERQDGSIGTSGGVSGKLNTRLKFPQRTADLSVRWCSAYLKIDVAARAIAGDQALKAAKILFLTGERRQESAARAKYAEVEQHRCHTGSRRVDQWRAVIDWSEDQVWDVIARWRIVPHPAYRLGWGRVSCLACIFGQPDQWASVRKVDPDRFDKISGYERRFGLTIVKGESVERQVVRGTPYAGCDDADLVKLAMSPSYPADDAIVPEGEEWKLPAGAYQRCGGPT